MLTKYSIEDIEFEVPNSWSVGEVGDAVEIVDSKAQGALHLSFVKRTRIGPPSESDALVLVENFALSNGLVPEGAVASNVEGLKVRAIGPFRANVPTSEKPMHWLVGCVVWSDRAVRASYCTDSLDDSFRMATAVIGSISRRGASS